VAIVRLAFICQAIDRADPVHATTARWVEVLAGKGAVDRVFVLALRTGRYRLPGNVEVREFGARNRPATLARFYREVVRALRGGIDCFFIHQGGPYPLLLLPLKLVLTKPVYQWKAHPLIGRAMAFYARWCDTKVFTSTRAAFPMELPKVRVVGQGIDTEFFRVMDVTKSADLVTVGRVSPIKRVAEMASAVAAANGRYGTSYRLDVVGPILPGDERYLAQVLRLIADRGAGESIRFTGPIDQGELPQVLNRHRAFLHFSECSRGHGVRVAGHLDERCRQGDPAGGAESAAHCWTGRSGFTGGYASSGSDHERHGPSSDRKAIETGGDPGPQRGDALRQDPRRDGCLRWEAIADPCEMPSSASGAG
jgi:glycosyltransferase involved in cell wall biosynthesis